jgi:flagellar basal-body rod modification protein FlgD
VTARDTTGGAVAVKSEIVGVVDSVDLAGDLPILKIGSLTVAIDKVKSISRN